MRDLGCCSGFQRDLGIGDVQGVKGDKKESSAKFIIKGHCATPANIIWDP